MGRPKTRSAKAGKTTHLSIVIDGAVILALDKEAERMTAAHPGLTITRTDVVRVLLNDWMTNKKEI